MASSHVYAGGLRRSLGFYFSPPPPPSWSVTRNKVESSGAAAELLQWLEATTLLKQEAFLLALVGNVESGEEMRREKKERASFAFLSFLFLLDIFSLLLAHFIFFPILNFLLCQIRCERAALLLQIFTAFFAKSVLVAHEPSPPEDSPPPDVRLALPRFLRWPPLSRCCC